MHIFVQTRLCVNMLILKMRLFRFKYKLSTQLA